MNHASAPELRSGLKNEVGTRRAEVHTTFKWNYMGSYLRIPEKNSKIKSNAAPRTKNSDLCCQK